MDHFDFRHGQLHAEDIAVSKLAEQYGTPCYIYSRSTIEQHWNAFDSAFKNVRHSICYAVKANSNLAVLNIMARMGSGFDIVSGGELARVLAAGGDAKKVVFSGVGKASSEIEYALQQGIRCFNVESVAELERINSIAEQKGLAAPISIRVNPDVDAQTHPYISTGLKENKFGIDIDQAENVYLLAKQMSAVEIVGIDCHIGSQLISVEPFVDALKRVLLLVDRLAEQEIQLEHLDIGGGLGITYKDEIPPSPQEYAQALEALLQGRDIEILMEPGRAIVGNAGILLTSVEYIKETDEHNFAIVDAAMNDLLRPALYQSWQDIVSIDSEQKVAAKHYDIVGPVCETGDFLGKDRLLAIQQGDILAVRSAGAYGFTMSSNYNSRPRVAELMVDGDRAVCIRKRETVESLYELEQVLPD